MTTCISSRRPLILAALFLVSSGCGSAAPTTGAGADTSLAPRRASAGNRNPRAVSNDRGTSGPCEVRPAYFAYDSSELDESSRAALVESARCIKTEPTNRVAVVGMSDPRGTEEYNLALGDKRARTTAQYMKALGVDDAVLAPQSAGEEYAAGEDESGWARDRRAEIRRQ